MYGNPDAQPEQTPTQVTGKDFTELKDNILNSEQALKTFAGVSKELEAAANKLKQKADQLKQESFVDTIDGNFYAEVTVKPTPVNNANSGNTGNPSSGNPSSDSSTPPAPQPTQAEKSNKAIEGATDANTVQAVYDVIKKISEVFAVRVTNTLINKFYKDSYNVYRDIVQAYKQEVPANNQQTGGENNNA